MNSFLTALDVERRKLRRSMVLPLALAAPGLIGIFTLANVLRAAQPIGWSEWLAGATTIWAFFLMPMSVTASGILLGHIEHAGRSFDHLRALPGPRWTLYAAKAAAALALILAMTLGAMLFAVLAVSAGALINPEAAPSGAFSVLALFGTALRLCAAAMLMVAVQIWLSLRFTSFVPALVAGIAGTFFAVVAPDAALGALLPWHLPLRALSPEAATAGLAVWWGALAGGCALSAMILHLARREVI